MQASRSRLISDSPLLPLSGHKAVAYHVCGKDGFWPVLALLCQSHQNQCDLPSFRKVDGLTFDMNGAFQSANLTGRCPPD